MHHYCLILLFCVLLVSVRAIADTAPGDANQALVVDLDGSGQGRVYEGIGALSAGASSRLLIDYPEPLRSEILDFLFKPNYGASFQHLKIEVGGDGNSTLGSEPSHARTKHELEFPEEAYFNRGYEWWLAKEAKKRNPDIILDCLPWAAAGWVEPFTADNAEYMISFLKGAKKYHGLDFDYVGGWNEFRAGSLGPQGPDSPYPGIWGEFRRETEYFKLFRRMLDENGFEKVKIVAADDFTMELENGDIYSAWTIAEKMLKDPELAQAVDAIGAHYAGYVENAIGEETFDSSEAAKKTGKPLWSSEAGLNKLRSVIPEKTETQMKEYEYVNANRDAWPGAQEYAKIYNRCYITGKMTKQVVWCPISSYYKHLLLGHSYGAMEAAEPWSGNYRVYPTIWATAHTTQFAQPGWRYCDSGCVYLSEGGSCVTLRGPDSDDYSVIIETFGATKSQTVTFRVSNGLSKAPLKVWKSISEEHMLEKDAVDIQPEDGSFSMFLLPNCIYTLTTTTGQQKGHTEILPKKQFPFPYSDTFRNYAVGRTPKYLSDMEGAFEIIEDGKGGKKCLAQVVESPVLSWGGLHSSTDPYSLIGSGDWSDYQVSADVFVESAGYAGIIGRHNYTLKLYHDGRWELTTIDKTLASGSIGEVKPQWHNLKLVMKGKEISPYIDNIDVTHGGIEDASYASGMAGLKSSWNRTKFKNLVIKQ